MKTITITLDEYEVANLRELLRCCGMPHSSGHPFPYNTVAWLGQIYYKLKPMETELRPNVTLEQVKGGFTLQELNPEHSPLTLLQGNPEQHQGPHGRVSVGMLPCLLVDLFPLHAGG